MSSSSSTPPFDPDGSYYDQSTYQGRFLGFLDVVDPRTLFTSDEELERLTLATMRARRTWIFMTTVALFANASLLALPLVFDEDFRAALLR